MEQKKGYISVIIPVYNVEAYLHRCMETVLAQTYDQLEIILVDDGSTDQSGAICDEYATKDARIQVIHKQNGGLSSARNVALDIAQGEYIGFVDSDDYINTDMFEKLYHACEKKQCDMAICNHYTEKADKLLIEDAVTDKEEIYTNIEALDILIQDNGMKNYAWDKLYKASLFEGIRYPEGRNYEDIATTYLLFYRAGKICRIPDYLYYYQIREGSISNHPSEQKWAANCYQIILSQLERYHFMQDKKEAYLTQMCLAKLVPYLYEYIRLGAQLHGLEYTHEVLSLLHQERDNIMQNEYVSEKDKKHFSVYTSSPQIIQIYVKIKPKAAKVLDILGKHKWLKQLEQKYDFTLKEGKNKRIIIFELPGFDNLGDHAISYAQLQFAQDIAKKHPQYQVYVVDGWETKAATMKLKKFIGRDDVIICQGGGNLGSLYPFADAMRKTVMDSFPHHKIIVLPQTIYFSSDKQGDETKKKIVKTYGKCDDLTICARDHVSYQLMKALFSARIIEVNDIVAYLSGKIEKSDKKRNGILLVLRSDVESALSADEKKRLQSTCRQQTEQLHVTDTCTGQMVERQDREKELQDKWKMFSEAELVVTDRLHGMIFSLITGTPCIILGNNHHKVRATYETFKDCEYLWYANSVDEAQKLIQTMYSSGTKYNPYNTSECYKELEQLIVQ